MKKTVLVVDDDPGVRRLVRRALEAPDTEVLEANDGDQAIEVAAKTKPDLVFLDMHMPRYDGIAALGELLEMNRDLRVVMITGDGNEERARLALERGAVDFLSKPFGPQALEAALLGALAVETKL